MTTNEIHALVAQCKAAKETGQWARLWAALTPDMVAELARDAARFRHVRETAELGRMGASPAVYVGFGAKITARHVSIQDMRDAITKGIIGNGYPGPRKERDDGKQGFNRRRSLKEAFTAKPRAACRLFCLAKLPARE